MKIVHLGIAGFIAVGAAAVPASCGPTAPALGCTAAMSNATPTQGSTIYVKVHSLPAVNVRTVAYYKTTSTAHTAKTDARTGNVNVQYNISRATVGYKVVVKVGVTQGTRTAGCQTAFTPHA